MAHPYRRDHEKRRLKQTEMFEKLPEAYYEFKNGQLILITPNNKPKGKKTNADI